MDRYQEAAKKALEKDGDNLTYNTLIQKLDQAFIGENEPDIFIARGTTALSSQITGQKTQLLSSYHTRQSSLVSLNSSNEDNVSLSRSESLNTTRRKKKSKQKNPFLEYGTAIENFFNLECHLIAMFFVLTLLAIPQMAVFLSYNAIRDFEQAGVLDQFSFAAFGQANTVCSKAPVLPDSTGIKFLFSCNDSYRVKKTISSGVLSVDKDIWDGTNTLKVINTVCYESPEIKSFSNYTDNVNNAEIAK